MQAHAIDPESYKISEQGETDAHTSGISWGAVFAGAVAAAALSLILLILGMGLGLSAISPWSYNTGNMGTSTIIWVAFMELTASGVGGYLAGRLRLRWTHVHTDEVYFRDTAHGLLTWAVASLITAVLLAGVVRAILSGAIDVGTHANTSEHMSPIAAPTSITALGPANSMASPIDYFSGMLLRSDQISSDASYDAMRGEVSNILATDIVAGKLSVEDRDYLARSVAKRTGMSAADAEQRVDAIYASFAQTRINAQEAAREAAEKTRKAAAHSALWMFVALLIGAFVASLSATIGGRQRDCILVLPIRPQP